MGHDAFRVFEHGIFPFLISSENPITGHVLYVQEAQIDENYGNSKACDLPSPREAITELVVRIGGQIPSRRNATQMFVSFGNRIAYAHFILRILGSAAS